MSHQHHDIVVSGHFKEPADALIDAARAAKKQHADGKQVLHIIFVNLILQDKKWQAVTSITAIDDIDGDGKPAIIFGWLPAKYEEHFDDLLPEVDHLNLINNYAVWRDIKTHLLDLHFYQAVHFGEIQRMSDSAGQGFFQEKRDRLKIETALAFDFNNAEDQNQKEVKQRIIDTQHQRFETEAKILEVDRSENEYEILLRNQREGRKFTNLVVK